MAYKMCQESPKKKHFPASFFEPFHDLLCLFGILFRSDKNPGHSALEPRFKLTINAEQTQENIQPHNHVSAMLTVFGLETNLNLTSTRLYEVSGMSH